MCASGVSDYIVVLVYFMSSFNTIVEMLIYFSYEPKQKCQVTYRKSGKTCKTLKFSCSSVDIENKDASKCRKGSKLFVGKEV